MTRFFLTATAIAHFLAALIVAVISFCLASSSDFSYLLVICLPITLWLIATGVGLLLKLNWARVSVFLLSGMAIILGISLWIYLISVPDSGETPLIMMIIKTIFIGLTGVIFIALPIINFIFFTRQSTKELFVSKVKVQREVINADPIDKPNNEIIKDKIFLMKWFCYYSYFLLPVMVISLLSQVKSLGEIESWLIVVVSIFHIFVIIGLHQRKLWSWKLNWGVLIFLTLLIPFQIARMPYWMGVILVAYLWFFPNYIYFTKRKHLFGSGAKLLEDNSKRVNSIQGE